MSPIFDSPGSGNATTVKPIPAPVEFVALIEAGALERQALWLCASIRRFGGRYRQAPITVISPRPSRRPSGQSRAALQRLGVKFVAMNIASPCPDYGPSFRVLACAEYEARARAESLVALDSDTLFLAEPQLDLEGCDAAARPVDLKGMCTTGDGDERDAYWRALCRVNGVDYTALPFLLTTVDRCMVRASYNGGFVIARPSAGIFHRTAQYWLRAVQSDLRPWARSGIRVVSGHGVVSEAGSEHWGSGQACLSLALWGHGCSVRILPESHNFPLHYYELLAPSHDVAADIVHVHYHHLFEPEQMPNPLVQSGNGFPAAAVEWVRGLVADGGAEVADSDVFA
jgi:hypothetical protein